MVILQNPPVMTPPIRMVTLSDGQMDAAQRIGIARANAGASRPLPEGMDQRQTDIVGVMGELAVCLAYGADVSQVQCYARRPSNEPDLLIDGWPVSVKSTERWEGKLTLFWPVHDRGSQIAFLVSVDVNAGACGIRGWVRRQDLTRYPPSVTAKRSGGAPTYNIPVSDLRPCKPH